ncbi:MAG TPA: acyl carrier protein [Actinospica sp.]|jgi:acyl carrier protein|nr:acyl carrier protein [Actinospica sp.]
MLVSQEKVSQVVAEVIGIDVSEVDVETNFFDLGGNSLLMITLVDALKAALGVETSIVTWLEFPTVEAFVDHWNGQQEGTGSAPADHSRA